MDQEKKCYYIRVVVTHKSDCVRLDKRAIERKKSDFELAAGLLRMRILRYMADVKDTSAKP